MYNTILAGVIKGESLFALTLKDEHVCRSLVRFFFCETTLGLAKSVLAGRSKQDGNRPIGQ